MTVVEALIATPGEKLGISTIPVTVYQVDEGNLLQDLPFDNTPFDPGTFSELVMATYLPASVHQEIEARAVAEAYGDSTTQQEIRMRLEGEALAGRLQGEASSISHHGVQVGEREVLHIEMDDGVFVLTEHRIKKSGAVDLSRAPNVEELGGEYREDPIGPDVKAIVIERGRGTIRLINVADVMEGDDRAPIVNMGLSVDFKKGTVIFAPTSTVWAITDTSGAEVVVRELATYHPPEQTHTIRGIGTNDDGDTILFIPFNRRFGPDRVKSPYRVDEEDAQESGIVVPITTLKDNRPNVQLVQVDESIVAADAVDPVDPPTSLQEEEQGLQDTRDSRVQRSGRKTPSKGELADLQRRGVVTGNQVFRAGSFHETRVYFRGHREDVVGTKYLGPDGTRSGEPETEVVYRDIVPDKDHTFGVVDKTTIGEAALELPWRMPDDPDDRFGISEAVVDGHGLRASDNGIHSLDYFPPADGSNHLIFANRHGYILTVEPLEGGGRLSVRRPFRIHEIAAAVNGKRTQLDAKLHALGARVTSNILSYKSEDRTISSSSAHRNR